METSAQFIVSHANKKRKRGKNPSLPYNGERNPRKALLLALSDIEKLKLLVRKKRVFNNSPFGIGSGYYCPDCGGLCGNDKHTRKW